MSVLIVCSRCDGTGKHELLSQRLGLSPTCRACHGTGIISLKDELHCSECHYDGMPGGLLIYQDIVGTTAIWRCRRGHSWSAEIAATA
jgi:hypothetical protein